MREIVDKRGSTTLGCISYTYRVLCLHSHIDELLLHSKEEHVDNERLINTFLQPAIRQDCYRSNSSSHILQTSPPCKKIFSFCLQVISEVEQFSKKYGGKMYILQQKEGEIRESVIQQYRHARGRWLHGRSNGPFLYFKRHYRQNYSYFIVISTQI